MVRIVEACLLIALACFFWKVKGDEDCDVYDMGAAVEQKFSHCNDETCDTGTERLYESESQDTPHHKSIVTANLAKPVYEFPPLTRLEPGDVGDTTKLELQPGTIFKRITRSVRPPVFEIPGFLSDEECNTIIDAAVKKGMDASQLYNPNIEGKLGSGLNSSEIKRISKTAWIKPEDIGSNFLASIHQRLSELTHVPVDVIQRSESLQVVSYEPAGHFHAHLDSRGKHGTHCCWQKYCDDSENIVKCCRLCRLVTVLYFLNDVEAGGETAFPLADMPDDLYEEKLANTSFWSNLSKFCHNSSLVITPKRGTAVMWYNHFLDEQGYLDHFDRRTHHGGCDVIKGNKWIATNWIASTFYETRFEPSIHFTP